MNEQAAGNLILNTTTIVLTTAFPDGSGDSVVAAVELMRAMEPNCNTVAAGLVALHLACGDSVEQIAARFRAAHERAAHAPNL